MSCRSLFAVPKRLRELALAALTAALCATAARGAPMTAAAAAPEPRLAGDALREQVIADLANGRELRPLWAHADLRAAAGAALAAPRSDLGADVASLAARVGETASRSSSDGERDLLSLLERLAA